MGLFWCWAERGGGVVLLGWTTANPGVGGVVQYGRLHGGGCFSVIRGS